MVVCLEVSGVAAPRWMSHEWRHAWGVVGVHARFAYRGVVSAGPVGWWLVGQIGGWLVVACLVAWVVAWVGGAAMVTPWLVTMGASIVTDDVICSPAV